MNLRPYQIPAVEALAQAPKGIVQAPCGSGKTIIAAAALAQARRAGGPGNLPPGPVLWLANTLEQIAQARQAVELMAGEFPDQIHFTCPAGVKSHIADLSTIDILVVDECHHAAAPSWAAIIEGCTNASHKWGISATPQRADELRERVFDLLGPIVHTVSPGDLGEQRVGATAHIVDLGAMPHVLDTVCRASGGDTPEALWGEDTPQWRKRRHYRALIRYGVEDNTARNAKIVAGVRYYTAMGDRVLVIVPTVRHGLTLAGKIGIESELVHSRIGRKRREKLIDEFRAGEIPCLIATSLADEGLDVPAARVLFMAAPCRSERQTEQRTGRVLRALAGKADAEVFDFRDGWHPWLAGQAKARAKVYRRLGYTILEHGRAV